MTGTRVVDIAMVVLGLSVYGLVALQSPGYDDEFHNIRWLLEAQSSGGWRSYFELASIDSLHPTGSYLLDFALYGLLREWEHVRAFKSVAVFLLAWLLLGRMFSGLRWGRLDLRVLLLLSPSLLLWCTGLRWFGEFSVLMLAAAGADRLLDRERWYFYPILGTTVLAMIHTNYIGIVFGPLIFAFHLVTHPSLRSHGGAVALTLLLLALGSALPLAEVLAAPKDSQTGGFVASVAGTLQGLLVNHGVFPLSPPGIATLLATTALFVLTVALRFRELLQSRYGLLATVLVIALALSGLGVKFRNVTPTLPLVYGTVFSLALYPRPGEKPAFQRLLKASLLLFLVTNIYGLVNVVAHARTAKGSWNLPVAETIRQVEDLTQGCTDEVVVVWDPVLQYHLWEAEIDTADLIPTALGGDSGLFDRGLW